MVQFCISLMPQKTATLRVASLRKSNGDFLLTPKIYIKGFH